MNPMNVLNRISLVLLNEKRFKEWKSKLTPERIYLYRGWWWYSLNKITKEENGFYHVHFRFFKFNKYGKLLFKRYYWRTKEPYEWTEKEMAENVIINAIVCGFWEEAKLI